jgi:hypothetical protein
MIGLALAIIIVGIVFGLVIPWVGIVVGLTGFVLFIALVARSGRRAAPTRPVEPS